MTKELKIMTCGSVDDGKSTLLGNLLLATNNIHQDTLQTLDLETTVYRKSEFQNEDLSLLLDGLLDEKEQGITIDIGFKYFYLGRSKLTLIDSPGHVEFTKNTANAATFAELALILIDVEKGISEQTLKHIEITNMFKNIKKVVFCINKIDKTNYRKKEFESIKKELEIYCNKKNFKIDEVIPTSAIHGDNVSFKSEKTKYYEGPSLLQYLLDYKFTNPRVHNYSLQSVQFITKTKNSRNIAAKNIIGKVNKKDTLYNLNTGQSAVISQIYKGFQKVDEIKPLENLSLEFKNEISISKGDTLSSIANPPEIKNTSSMKVKFVWVSDSLLLKSKKYLFQFKGGIAEGYFSKIDSKNVSINSIVEATLELDKKILVSADKDIYEYSKFICIDLDSKLTNCFGSALHALDKGIHVSRQKLTQFAGYKEGKCILLTGLPSSGKSTIAEGIGKQFQQREIPYYILDGDNMRLTLNKDLGFSNEDRIENNRRIAHVAKILYESGVTPIIATVSPNSSSRDFTRSLFPEEIFFEVYIKASLETCMTRDVKNLYSSKTKKIKNITGVHQEYNEPTHPEITVDTEKLTISQSISLVLQKMEKDN